MKIYFTAAIAQKPQFGENYRKIIETLVGLGHQVQHEHITGKQINDIALQNEDELNKYYRQVVRWITDADIMVAEASFPSTLNIGHEISLSLDKSKPVIVFYKKGYDSFFLRGLNSDKLFLLEYTDDNIQDIVRSGIDFAKDQADTRFNFFISPSLSHYLDWISQSKKIPRSVYLRQLIEQDREKNTEYFES